MSLREAWKRRRIDGGRPHMTREEKAALYHKEHREEFLSRARKWRMDNRERSNQYSNDWVERNPEERKRIQVSWRRRNPEKVRIYRLLDYDRHPETYREAKRRYRNRYRDKHVAWWRAARARRGNALGSFTTAEWQLLVALFDNRCGYCWKGVKLEADHVVPLSKGGTNFIENILPACRSCNARKGASVVQF